jgi:diaminohydroxyphosphoribosylaminopyrimidine deaminase/5-amino-6-(5-phosphoribosylamino)uracil reductase
LIAPFAQYAKRTLPWTVLKWAMSADGKVATTSGDARWISCDEEVVAEGHEERARANAVLRRARHGEGR